MAFKKLLSALGDLAVRTVSLVFKLCGVVLTVLLQAFVAGATRSNESDEHAAQVENDEYYSRAAATHYEDWYGK